MIIRLFLSLSFPCSVAGFMVFCPCLCQFILLLSDFLSFFLTLCSVVFVCLPQIFYSHHLSRGQWPFLYTKYTYLIQHGNSKKYSSRQIIMCFPPWYHQCPASVSENWQISGYCCKVYVTGMTAPQTKMKGRLIEIPTSANHHAPSSGWFIYHSYIIHI